MPFVICPTHLQKIHGIVGIVWRFLRNKNLGNFLWTGFMTPATAVPRFGSDLMELVVEAALSPQSWAGGMLKHVESCWNMLKWSEMWLDMTWCHLLFMSLHCRTSLSSQVELARLGGAYRGYSRGLLDAEHRLKGQYSLLGDLSCNDFSWLQISMDGSAWFWVPEEHLVLPQGTSLSAWDIHAAKIERQAAS